MKKVGITESCMYSNVETDFDGWVDVRKFLPADFDLCFLRMKNNTVKTGWAVGGKFDGLRINHDDHVISWKKNRDVTERIYATSKR